MDKFWRINKWISVVVFKLFIIIALSMFYFRKSLGEREILFFMLPFFELIHFPVSLIIYLATSKKTTMNLTWFFVLMIVFFAIKTATYVWLMSGLFR